MPDEEPVDTAGPLADNRVDDHWYPEPNPSARDEVRRHILAGQRPAIVHAHRHGEACVPSCEVVAPPHSDGDGAVGG